MSMTSRHLCGSWRSFCVLLALFVWSIAGVARGTTSEDENEFESFVALVVGMSSDNVVLFDLGSGHSRVFAKLKRGDKPRSIAVDGEGRVYVGLSGNRRNIIELTQTRRGIKQRSVTRPIGKYGPGQMGFDSRGHLVIAGDSERALLRFKPKEKAMLDPIPMRATNIVALCVDGDRVFVGEYFQRTIYSLNLTKKGPSMWRFLRGSSRLDRPFGMTIGPQGHLLVGSLRASEILQFDSKDGSLIGTYLDVAELELNNVKDLRYVPWLETVFFTSGHTLYCVDHDRKLGPVFDSELIRDARSVAIVAAETLGIRDAF